MSFDTLGLGALDYKPCRYGDSKTLFRGPKRDLNAPFIAFLGGSNTYGRFVPAPFPDLVEQALDFPCVNFGAPNAGIDLMLYERALQKAVIKARATVIQIVSPRNMSNRFYTVHPRRNDRFLKPSVELSSVYPEVDFAEFNFTKHMLQRLHKESVRRFNVVVDELRQAWSARMQLLLSKVPGPVVLLWMSDHEPGQPYEKFGTDPWFVTREMIAELQDLRVRYVEVVASDAALSAGTEGMLFSEMEAPAAASLLGPKVHEETTRALVPVLRDIVE